ncbi:hypothetical protein CRENBAI_026105 [Crenichthys baileyi]|uniref:Uncharacterized protein n=1 Tax=Crenichthys baileyi TaxID=28760 RepID=A0AAV9SN33_9TELE
MHLMALISVICLIAAASGSMKITNHEGERLVEFSERVEDDIPHVLVPEFCKPPNLSWIHTPQALSWIQASQVPSCMQVSQALARILSPKFWPASKLPVSFQTGFDVGATGCLVGLRDCNVNTILLDRYTDASLQDFNADAVLKGFCLFSAAIHQDFASAGLQIPILAPDIQ